MKIRFLTCFLSVLCLQLAAQNLPKYTCMTAYYDLDKWVGQAERKIDSTGVLVQKKQYHPLSICLFGIMSYEKFLETGDVKYKKQVLDQYQYFCDTSKIDLVDSGKGLGLPYQFKFHDLKVPWYSGMTQGTGISYLLRYYKLSGDKTALTRAEQIAAFMLKPQEKGGTVSRQKDGSLWIEEYPKSKSAPGVMNGFINGLIGLYEYCSFFPKDTLARHVHDSCYAALIRSFPKYDTPDWTNYHRTGSSVTNGYMRYQIQELQHLYEIYHDERLRQQMMIWSMMAYKKKDTSPGAYFQKDYEFAIGMQCGTDSVYRLQRPDYEKALEAMPTVRAATGMFHLRKKELPVLPDKRTRFYLKEPVYCAAVYFDSLNEKDSMRVTVYTHHGTETVLPVRKGKNLLIISGDPFSSFSVQPVSKTVQTVRSVSAVPVGANGVPLFGFYKTAKKVELKKGERYHVTMKQNGLDNGLIFFRCVYPLSQSTKTRWKYQQTFRLKENFIVPEDGPYEFFIAFPYQSSNAAVQDFKVVPSK